MTKGKALIAGLSSLALASLICLTCFALGNPKGKDGKDGRDATISVSDDGELILNGNGTGLIGKKADCKVALDVEGKEYGRVVGGGTFSKGETVAVEAIPNVDACFKGWKNEVGEIVSLNPLYTFVATEGEVRLAALFEKSQIAVLFQAPKNVDSYFDGGIKVTMNGEEKSLAKERDMYGNQYYFLANPASFSYAETVTISFPSFLPPSCIYHCYLREYENAGQVGFPSGEKGRYEITDSLEYTFTITENRLYYFVFEMELNIFVDILPTIEIYSNNEEYGTVSKSSYSSKGDMVTLSASAKSSGSEDFIYSFKGWYRGEELVTEEETYSFVVNESETFEARFVKKYALWVEVAILSKETNSRYLDPTTYYVSYKNLRINASGIDGDIRSFDWQGNSGGQTPDLAAKCCGYFEIGEKIFLSSVIENDHSIYYELNGTGKKTYREKFVYSRWVLEEDSSEMTFATGSSALFFFNETMDMAKTKIKVELFVARQGENVEG